MVREKIIRKINKLEMCYVVVHKRRHFFKGSRHLLRENLCITGVTKCRGGHIISQNATSYKDHFFWFPVCSILQSLNSCMRHTFKSNEHSQKGWTFYGLRFIQLRHFYWYDNKGTNQNKWPISETLTSWKILIVKNLIWNHLHNTLSRTIEIPIQTPRS